MIKLTSETKDPTWREISTRNQKPQFYHTSTRFDHYIISISGNCQREAEEEIYVFDIDTETWHKPQLTGDQLQLGKFHTACLFNTNKIVVYGGIGGTYFCNDVFIFTIISENQKEISLNIEKIPMGNESLGRYKHSSEIIGDKMYVFGGSLVRTAQYNELWCLNLKDFKWTECEQKGDIPPPRYRHKSFLFENKMYIFGGLQGWVKEENLNDLFCLDLDTLHWSEVKYTGTAPYPSHTISLAENEGLIYAFGNSTLFNLDIKNNKWKVIPTNSEPPEERWGHTMTCYKDEIFVYGGGNKIFCLNIAFMNEQSDRDDLDQISKFYLKSLFSDVIFKVQEKKFFAHKLVLATRCKFFSNLFSSGMAESDQKEIEIKECKSETFEALLKYIYCDKIKFTEEVAMDMFLLCKKWMFKKLEEECEIFLSETLTLKNIIERAKLAEKLDSTKLITAITSFIVSNKVEAEKSGILFELPSFILAKAITESTKPK